MIDFDEELKHYKPSQETEEAERDVYEHDITDITDVMQQFLKEANRSRGNGML